mmetsp:Transcript_54621/g.142662  ORF Transcript_54621/g.142662 Transcript_54621/m.142662 type:complete len:96 (+) Transcript_54621:2-289(+)
MKRCCSASPLAQCRNWVSSTRAGGSGNFHNKLKATSLRTSLRNSTAALIAKNANKNDDRKLKELMQNMACPQPHDPSMGKMLIAPILPIGDLRHI